MSALPDYGMPTHLVYQFRKLGTELSKNPRQRITVKNTAHAQALRAWEKAGFIVTAPAGPKIDVTITELGRRVTRIVASDSLSASFLSGEY